MLTPIYSLLARMPHSRIHKGKLLPLQTPQAFTNRSYRFRVPNQIPASKMKNGSAAYKREILKNLAKESATTTEALPTLNPDQVDEIRKINKGKFTRNSRYVVKDNESRGCKKRKSRAADDVDSELEQEEPKAKKRHYQTSQNMGAEPNIVGDPTPDLLYNNTVGDLDSNAQGYYNAPTEASGPWHGQEQDVSPAENTNLWAEQSEEDLVPLFATTEDQEVALLLDSTFTSPSAVIWARRNGHQNTALIGVHYYRQSTPRHIDEYGFMVADVAHNAFSSQWETSEPIPGHTQQFPSQIGSNSSAIPPMFQNDIPPAVNPVFEEPGDGVYSDFLVQAPNAIPLTPVTGMYAPGHGMYPSTLTQAPNYPQVTPSMSPYAPTRSVYTDNIGQTPNNPLVTPVTTLQAPLPFQNRIGRYQTESDAAEEVWRHHHGSRGF